MALDNLFKLEKLKIKAFSDRRRSPGDLVGTFEAMFNPESFKRSYEIVYGRGQGIGSSGQSAAFSQNRPSDLNLRLVLDGTGVHEMGIVQLGGTETVRERVDKFLDWTFKMNGETREPNFLRVEWGEINFSCRLGNVDISYTSFDRDGKALRAELDVTFIADTEEEKRLREENRSSPDLTHTRIVRSGDTLPLLSKEIYGNSEHFLFIANANDLDDFRNLTPGQELFFPPLVIQKS